MGDSEANLKVPAIGWAARDHSGHMSPYSFNRRETGPKDVKMTVKFCGMCHSDLHMVKNEWGISTYPLVPGHEITGIASEVGSEVTKFKVGDRVGIGCLVNSCRECDSCKQGDESYCSKFTLTYGWKDFDGSITMGGYSNIVVCNEDFVLKIPDGLPLDGAAPLLCAGITMYSPMMYFDMLKGGKNFAVIGLGGLGHMGVKFAKALGMNVTVISTTAAKEKEARERLKADNFIASKDEAQMKAAVGTLDFIIDTVSAPHAMEPYISLLKNNGKLIVVGAPPTAMEIVPSTLIFGRKLVAGSATGGQAEIQKMLDFCGEKNLTCEIEKIPISYVNTAYERLLKSDVHYRFVIDVENTLKPEA